MTAEEVIKATQAVDPAEQLEAWGVVSRLWPVAGHGGRSQQGTERWHKLRACRVTASNFGSAHCTNGRRTPAAGVRRSRVLQSE
jgi:hypothetical protein